MVELGRRHAAEEIPVPAPGEAEAVAVPWVKLHTVPHLPTDCTAMLKLIETRFHVPALTQRDATLPPAI